MWTAGSVASSLPATEWHYDVGAVDDPEVAAGFALVESIGGPGSISPSSPFFWMPTTLLRMLGRAGAQGLGEELINHVPVMDAVFQHAESRAAAAKAVDGDRLDATMSSYGGVGSGGSIGGGAGAPGDGVGGGGVGGGGGGGGPDSDTPQPGLRQQEFVGLVSRLSPLSPSYLTELFVAMDEDGDGIVSFADYINALVHAARGRVERGASSGGFHFAPPLWREQDTVQVVHGVAHAVPCPSLAGLAVVTTKGTLQVWDNEFHHCLTLQTTDCPAPVPHCIPLTAPPPVLGLHAGVTAAWSATVPRDLGSTVGPSGGSGGHSGYGGHGGHGGGGGGGGPRAGSSGGVGGGGGGVGGGHGAGVDLTTSLALSSTGDLPPMSTHASATLPGGPTPAEPVLLLPSCEYVLQAGSVDCDRAVSRGSDSVSLTGRFTASSLVASPRAARLSARLRSLQRSAQSRPGEQVMSPLGFTFGEATVSPYAVQAAAMMVEGMHQRSQWEAEDPTRRRQWTRLHQRNSVAGPGLSTGRGTATGLHMHDAALPQHLLSAVRASKAQRAPRVSDLKGLTVTAVTFDAAQSRLLVAYVDRVVRVWDLSTHRAESTLSLKAIVKRRAAVINVREVAKVEKESIARLIRLRGKTGADGTSDPGFLSAIVRTLRARVMRSSDNTTGDDSQPYATMQDDESIHTIGPSNDLAMAVSCTLAFGVGPDVPQALCVAHGRYVAGGSSGFLSVFDASTCTRLGTILVSVLRDGIRAVEPVGALGVVVGGVGGPMCVVDTTTLCVVHTFSVSHDVGVHHLAWCPSEGFIASAGADGRVFIWDPVRFNKAHVAEIIVSSHSSSHRQISALEVSDVHHQLVVVKDNGHTQVFDTRTLAATQSCRDWLVTKCTTATFNGERFITWGTYGRAWSIHPIVAPPTRGTEGLAVLETMHSASIAQIVVVLSNGDVKCYSTQSGRLVNSFSVAPGATEDTGVHVVVAEAYQATLTVGEAARDRQDVVCACLDKKGRRLLTAFADGTIVWWSLGNGELLRQYRGPRNVTCLRYHSSGVSHPVVAGSWTGVAMVLSEGGRGGASGGHGHHSTGVGGFPSRPTTGRRLGSRSRASRLSGGASSPHRGPPSSGGIGGSSAGGGAGNGGGGGGGSDADSSSGGNQTSDGLDTCLLRAPGVVADVLCVACGLSPLRESYIPVPWVVTGHADGRIVLWSAASWRPLSQHVAIDPVTISGVHGSKRSSRTMGAGSDTIVGSAEASARGSTVEHLCWLPHSGVVVAGCGSGYLHVLSLQHDALIRPPPVHHGQAHPYSASPAAPGQAVGVGSGPGLALGSSVASGKRVSDTTGVLPEALTGDVAAVGGIAAPPAVTSMCDGTRGILVVGLQWGFIRTFHVATVSSEVHCLRKPLAEWRAHSTDVRSLFMVPTTVGGAGGMPVICSSGGPSVKLWFLDGTPVAELSATTGLVGTPWPRELFNDAAPGGSPMGGGPSLSPVLHSLSQSQSQGQGHGQGQGHRAAHRKSSPGPGPPWTIPPAFSITSAQPSGRTGGGYSSFSVTAGGPPSAASGFVFPLGADGHGDSGPVPSSPTPASALLPYVRTEFPSAAGDFGPSLDSTRSSHPYASPMRKFVGPGVVVGHSSTTGQHQMLSHRTAELVRETLSASALGHRRPATARSADPPQQPTSQEVEPAEVRQPFKNPPFHYLGSGRWRMV